MALARSVTVIPARRRTRNVDAEDKKKLKVAAYCRVSTDSEEQALVMKFKWNTTLPIFRTILNGNLQGFIRHLLQNKKRSEEHTSELQSRGHLVCRLLLEKKKNTNRSIHE